MRALCRSAVLALAITALVAAAASPALAVPRPAPPALTPVAADALTRALETGRLSEPQYALERARSLFQHGKVRAAFGDVERAAGRDTTLLLRDLALRLRFLSGEERREAEALLARSDDGSVPVGNGWSGSATRAAPRCSAPPVGICIHWVEDTPDRAAPAFVDEVQATLENVWGQEITTIGYKRPLADESSRNDGGGPELDVYLEDLGRSGLFGYCATDDPAARDPLVFAVSAFCVLDNDYSPVQFPAADTTPTEFLQVTAAHELFHAVQFAYDWQEDLWLLEGTAVNMEETVYPDVDDNLVFLAESQLRRPARSLDRSGFGDSEYGAWIFWRYLEEKAFGGDPTFIRRVWERADASAPFTPDDYSSEATRKALVRRGKSLQDEYASFGVANRLRDYQDGSKYPRPPTHAKFALGAARPTSRWRAARLNHLSTRFVTFRPGRTASRNADLRLDVRLSAKGARALTISYAAGSGPVVRPIRLGPEGKGGRRVPFGRGTVRRVDLVLVNASARTRRCWQDRQAPFFSCLGFPRDDGQTYRYRGAVR